MSRAKWSLLAVIACLASTAHALPEDRGEAINLSSNRATYENNQGIYSGDVQMSQGSLKIQADKLIIVETDRRVEKVVAHGNPARFEQQPRSNEGVVVASANIIEYKLQEEEIVLQDNASITHQGSKISGDRVVYSGKKQTVVADGGSAADSGRVKMTLQPQNLNAETGDKKPAEPAAAPSNESDTESATP